MSTKKEVVVEVEMLNENSNTWWMSEKLRTNGGSTVL